MGRKITFGLCVFATCFLLAPASVFAQCSWCTSVTDACCDGEFSSVDITTTCNASSVWVYYDCAASNRVEIFLYEVSGGTETLLAHVDDSGQRCNCAKFQIYSSVNADHVLRFKVNCEGCTDSCTEESVQVYFFTPNSNICAGNCFGS
jgi:hypothetical protein